MPEFVLEPNDLGRDDDLLGELDWVIASVHTSFRISQKAMTERVLTAIDHPLVDCIGHLTGRRLSSRPPGDVDLERVVAKAVETGTCLEINSQPDRLDLRDAHARYAAEAGVRIVVNSDGHSTDALGYVEFGIAQARRAWLTKAQVLNTHTLAQLRKALR